MKAIIEQMQKDAFAKLLGIELLSVEPGRAKVSMPLNDEHRNSVGMAHGGVIFTVADFAFAVACNSHGIPAVAINCHISFFKPPQGNRLTAEATEVSCSRRLGTYTVQVHDDTGTLVALFEGMAYRKV